MTVDATPPPTPPTTPASARAAAGPRGGVPRERALPTRRAGGARRAARRRSQRPRSDRRTATRDSQSARVRRLVRVHGSVTPRGGHGGDRKGLGCPTRRTGCGTRLAGPLVRQAAGGAARTEVPDPSAPPPAPPPVRSEPLPRVGPPPRPAPRPPTQRPVARPARAAPPALTPKPAESSVAASAGDDQVPEVIYVEDDAALAELLEYGLRAHGYRFLAYRNRRDALRELLALDVQGTHPLLLLDVDLPALDGYSILGALDRERPGTYRVVFTTVHGTEEEQLRGLEAGALDYLVKPISLRVALEKIKRWVGGGRGGR